MRKSGLSLFFVIVFLTAAPSFVFAEEPSAELLAAGKKLFENKEGLKVKYACITCHKGQKAIKRSDVEKAGDKLPVVINRYITQKSKGKALAPESNEMKALMTYIRYAHSK